MGTSMAHSHVLPTIFDSLAELDPSDLKRVQPFLKKFLDNPAHPSLQMERVDDAYSKDIWSARVNLDLRAICQKVGDTFYLLHIGHHDAAYKWAESKAIQVNPEEQFFRLVPKPPETVTVEKEEESRKNKPLFRKHADEYLVSLGVPEVWLPRVREFTNRDELELVADHLGEEIWNRLDDLARGIPVVPPSEQAKKGESVALNTFKRLFLPEDERALLAALEAPMHAWIAFLHPSQRTVVHGDYAGPVKVTGSAGTGKTVVAMHRARALAAQGKRVLLTSFATTLCANLERNLKLFCSEEELGRITVSTLDSQALSLVKQGEGDVAPATSATIGPILKSEAIEHAPDFDLDYVKGEWENVILTQGIMTWEQYRSAKRIGRGRGLSAAERKVLWKVFDGVRRALALKNQMDFTALSVRAGELLAAGEVESPFDAVVVDEVQDLKVPSLRLVAELCKGNEGNLLLVGDAGQRIYPGGFSLKKLGIDVRGRSHILRINYRTSSPIRRTADRILGMETDDLDGGTERRDGTLSLFNGPAPVFEAFDSDEAELEAAAEYVLTWIEKGLAPEAIGVFARRNSQVDLLAERLGALDVPVKVLGGKGPKDGKAVSVGTVYKAKGLEFKAVLVFGCNAETLPLRSLLSNMKDPKDREDAESRERRLFYVAMTRARDELRVTWSGEPSPFLSAVLDRREESRA